MLFPAGWFGFLIGGWIVLISYELLFWLGSIDEDLFDEWLPFCHGLSTGVRQFWLGATIATILALVLFAQ